MAYYTKRRIIYRKYRRLVRGLLTGHCSTHIQDRVCLAEVFKHHKRNHLGLIYIHPAMQETVIVDNEQHSKNFTAPI